MLPSARRIKVSFVFVKLLDIPKWEVERPLGDSWQGIWKKMLISLVDIFTFSSMMKADSMLKVISCC